MSMPGYKKQVYIFILDDGPAAVVNQNVIIIARAIPPKSTPITRP